MNLSAEKKNFFYHTLDGVFYLSAISFTSTEIVLSVLIYQLGGSAVAVGSVFALTEMGGSLTQLLSAPFLDNMRTKKMYVLIVGTLHRLPWLVLALWLGFGSPSKDGSSVAFMLTLITIAFLFGGILAPGWSSFLAATVKNTWRGRLFAIRQAIGGFLGILAGFAVAAILDHVAFPANFSLLFSITSALWFISLSSLAFIDEQPHVIRKHQSLWHYYRHHLPAILKQDRDFVWFIIIKAFMLFTLISFGFFSVYGLKRFDLPAATAGAFTTLFMVGHIACSFLFGWIADRFGHRCNILLFSAITILQSLIALYATSIWVYSIVFLFLGGNRSIQYITFMTMPLEYAESSDRPTYYALSQSITSPLYLAGIAGGFMVPWIGYEGLFWISIGFSFVVFFLAFYQMKEPRHHRPVAT